MELDLDNYFMLNRQDQFFYIVYMIVLYKLDNSDFCEEEKNIIKELIKC